MKLRTIISSIKPLSTHGELGIEVNGMYLDSRQVQPHGLFAAIAGYQVDGHDYIDAAVAAGAKVILCEHFEPIDGVTFIRVENSAEALGHLASKYYSDPSSKLKLVGVTGTNGKTSITSMLYELFRSMGHKVGLLSTIKYAINGVDHNSTHTTPNAIRIQELLAQMVQEGCEYAFMEVSSHAIDQDRISGLEFDGALFTNITHDHLDYHKTFKAYLYSKKKFFDGLSSDAFAVYNRDDKNGQVMVQNTKAVKYSYSLKSVSDFKTRLVEHDFEGMLLNIRGDEVWMRLVGEFNAYNVLAVYTSAFLLGKEHFEIITALSGLQSVEGRFQHIVHKGITAVVDYAHTPDALQNVIDTINAIRTKNESLICVVGCGGDRDKDKRPVMGRIAAQYCDKVILTSDNPRSEDPLVIIEEMAEGIEAQYYKKLLKINDREEAIKTAIALSNTGDVILVAGKGHEKYQEVKGVKEPFDDKEVIQRNFKLIHN